MVTLGHHPNDVTMRRLRTRVAELEAALLNLCSHHDAMAGERAHRPGCECGGGNDGIHFCSTLEQAFAHAKKIL